MLYKYFVKEYYPKLLYCHCKKMMLSIKDFFSKGNLKKSLMESFIFFAVCDGLFGQYILLNEINMRTSPRKFTH